MSEVVPDYRDGWRLENKEWTRVIMKTDSDTDIKEQLLDGTKATTLIVDEPVLKNKKTEDNVSDREMLDMVLKENYSLREKIDQVSAICDKWFAVLSPSDKIEMMVRYYQLRLNCYENNKKECE